MLEFGSERAGHDPELALKLLRQLGAVLFYAGKYTRSAAVFDTIGRVFRTIRQSTDAEILEASYYAGHAYAQVGKPKKALPHLRFYVENAHASANKDDTDQILESRFLIAQMLAAADYPDEALTELEAVRPALADAFGETSTQVRNLDKQIGKLRSTSS